jgi:hypothetical protein
MPECKKPPEGGFANLLILLVRLERAKGFEPSTPTLAMVCLDEYANNINDL